MWIVSHGLDTPEIEAYSNYSFEDLIKLREIDNDANKKRRTYKAQKFLLESEWNVGEVLLIFWSVWGR